MQKIKIVLIILCLLLVNVFISNSIRAEYFSSNTVHSSYFWKPIEVVSSDSTSYALGNNLDVDDSGNVHICWRDETDNYLSSGSDSDIFYRVWKVETKVWSAVSLVSDPSTDNSFDPDIKVDASGNVHIVWYDSPSSGDKDIFYRYFDKTSVQWHTVDVVSTESSGHSVYPSLEVDPSGNVHVSWRDDTNYMGSETDQDIFYKRRDKASESWTITEVISNGSTDWSEYSCLAVDELGNVHIVWDDHDSGMLGSGANPDIFYRHWDKTNKQWGTTKLVSTETTSGALIPYIVTDMQNNLHVAWHDITDFGGAGSSDFDIFYKRFDFASSSWTMTEVVSTESNGWSMKTKIAVDRYGRVHVVWEDISNYDGAGDTEYDIFYKFKNPSSGTWETTTVISAISTEASYNPNIDVDAAGMVHISWDDKTDYEGAGETTYHDIFYSKYGGVPETPVLNKITPSPSTDGVINVDWDDTFGAIQYYVYRDTSTITSVSGLTPITQITSSAYTETISLDETYYYAVVAENYLGNSSVSNCESVEVSLLTTITTTTTTTESKSSPGFSLITGLIGLLSVGMALFYRKRRHPE